MDVHLSAWAYSALLIRPYWSGIQPQPQIGTGRSGPQARISDNDRRRRFACPPRRGTFDEIDLSLLDPADPDDRRMLILAEHPEHAEAIERGEDEVLVGGETVSPQLHIAMHEIVTTQLWENDPPEAWTTARR